MNIDEKTIEQYLMEHPEIAYRVLGKRELKKSGNRSFKRKVEDPIGEIDPKMVEREAKREIERSRRELLKLAGLGVSAGLLGLLGGREWGFQEALAQSQAVQIEPNSFVIPASYVVFGDDLDNDGILDIIYARNGRTGQIDFKGNDASTIIQSAIDNLIDGGSTYIKTGSNPEIYLISSPIEIDDKISLVGDGFQTTILKLQNNVNDSLLKTKSFGSVTRGHIIIKDIGLNGNKANNTAGHGILGQMWNSLIDRVWVTDFVGSGIFLKIDGNENIIQKCRITNCGGDGIHIESGVNDGYLLNNLIYNNNGYQIQFINPWGWWVVNNHIYQIQTTAIRFEGIQRCFIVNNYIEGSDTYVSMALIGGTTPVQHNVVRGNVFVNGLDGLWLYGGASTSKAIYNIIVGNIFHSVVQSSIIEKNSQEDYNIIIGNYVSGSSPIVKLGVNTVVRDNVGYPTENSGVAVFSGDGVTTQFTIAHGLVSTPSSVRVTPGSVDASGQFYITVDNTNIYVNYLSAPPSGTNNITLYWEAEV